MRCKTLNSFIKIPFILQICGVIQDNILNINSIEFLFLFLFLTFVRLLYYFSH